MNTLPRWLFAVCLAGVVTLSGCSGSAVTQPMAYERLASAQPVATGQQIEVIEFYWFGCPHCADMHPRLQAWAQKQPSDVALRIEPVALSERWLTGSRLHHTLQALGELSRRSAAVFEAVQLDGLDVGNEAAVRAWAVAQGIDSQRFDAAWRSPEVQRQTAQSLEWGKTYQFTGVPTFIVDGKYLTSNRLTGSSPDTLKTVDELIRKARVERTAPG